MGMVLKPLLFFMSCLLSEWEERTSLWLLFFHQEAVFMVSTNIPFSGLGLLLSSALALMLPLVSFSISSISPFICWP